MGAMMLITFRNQGDYYGKQKTPICCITRFACSIYRRTDRLRPQQ